MRFPDHLLCSARLVWALIATALIGFPLVAPPHPALASTNLQQAAPDLTSALISASTRVNLRGGPGTNYLVLAKLEPGTAVTILARNATADWVRIRVTDSGRSGWVAADLLAISTAPAVERSLLPTPTPDPYLSPQKPDAGTEGGAQSAIVAEKAATTADSPGSDAPAAVTQPPNLNVRGGPGTNYPVVTSVPAGTNLSILALGPNEAWYKVKLAGHDEAWVLADLIKTSGTLTGLTKLAADQVPVAPEPVAAEPASAAVTSAAPVAVASAPPPAGGGFFAYGIQANLWQNAEKEWVADQIRGIGFTWVKQQIRWEFVEDSPGNVNWSEPDRVIEVMNGYGINVLFSAFTAPQWSRPDKPGTGGPPDDFNLYADFVGKIAERYCGRLGAIEIWNEQNLQREWEGHALDPAQYMDLLRRSYTAIKARCPSILVISGAPTPTGNSPVAIDDVDYLRGMYANGLAHYSDGVGVHPSGFGNPPEATVQDWQNGSYTAPPSHFDHRSFYFRSTMEAYRNVMVAAGDTNKRLWPTEFGWGSTSTPHPGYEYEAYISESTQAQYIVRAYLMMRDWGWVGVPFLWNLNFNEGEMAAFRVVGRPAYEALKGLPK